MESNDDFNLVKRILLHEPDLRGFRFFDKEASIPEQALKAEWTEELMSVLIDKKKIEALGLGTGLNFASDNSCQLLAELIDSASELEYINISKQVSEVRKIKLSMRVANQIVPGLIKVTDAKTGALICQKETQRSKEIEIDQR